MLSIDLNCDMGEGFPNDKELMPFISSVNIACGVHAGSPDIMRKTIADALRHRVVVGAHPSYPDRENFGRRDMIGSGLKPEDVPEILIAQLNQLEKICTEFGTVIHHIKPHGALYNRMAWDLNLSLFLCNAIAAWNPSLMLYGLSGSQMQQAADLYHIVFVPEAFADRGYNQDGSLIPRGEPSAMIEDPVKAAKQVVQLLIQGTVSTGSGREILVQAGTICIHGDHPRALEMAKEIRKSLHNNNIDIRPPEF
jgi:UPF0271 protein